jgi:O-antigen ligase
VATRPDESSRTAALRRLVDRDAVGAVVLALAVPFLFAHERYQPEASLDLGGTSIDVRLSDVAVLAVLVAAVVSAHRLGVPRLRPALAVWVPGIALLAWLAFQVLRPVSLDDARFDDHLVSYFKLLEYSLLVIAVPFVVRRAEHLTLVLGAIAVWATVATSVALAQFLGLDVLDAWNRGWRQPSFLGHHDLAALSALALSLAAAGIAVGRRRMPASSLFVLALAAGMLGLILAGSVAAAGGFTVGMVALWVAARRRFTISGRRVAALVAIVAVVAGGVITVRGDELGDFLRFVGLRAEESPQGVETYSQRTVLAYIGLRIFQDHPVLGVGWQRSSRPEVFEPYVPDARERFPDVVDLAFPAEGREWGVQNLYVQMLADAGVVGLVLVLALGAGGLLLAWRVAARASPVWAAGTGLLVLCALLTVGGEWASLGIVSGIPLQAATCLLLGLTVAGAGIVVEEAGG